ncbi:hypothetical protein FQA39_LY19421 [Lamprigera yunnana]|nr:hypothetical protein FQA39_LY19421 [Lamprigera yunnana]
MVLDASTRDMKSFRFRWKVIWNSKDSTGTTVVHLKMENPSDERSGKDMGFRPRELGVEPRGEQMNMKDGEVRNEFQQSFSKCGMPCGIVESIRMLGSFSNLTKGVSNEYKIHQEGTAFIVLLSKVQRIGEQQLKSAEMVLEFGCEMVFELEATEDAESC